MSGRLRHCLRIASGTCTPNYVPGAAFSRQEIIPPILLINMRRLRRRQPRPIPNTHQRTQRLPSLKINLRLQITLPIKRPSNIRFPILVPKRRGIDAWEVKVNRIRPRSRIIRIGSRYDEVVPLRVVGRIQSLISKRGEEVEFTLPVPESGSVYPTCCAAWQEG